MSAGERPNEHRAAEVGGVMERADGGAGGDSWVSSRVHEPVLVVTSGLDGAGRRGRGGQRAANGTSSRAPARRRK
jgi:hypothetical protein